MLGLMGDLCKLIWCGFAGLFWSRASLQADILMIADNIRVGNSVQCTEFPLMGVADALDY